jgi:hypothetical protein
MEQTYYPEIWYPPTRLNGNIIKKITIYIFSSAETSYLIFPVLYGLKASVLGMRIEDTLQVYENKMPRKCSYMRRMTVGNSIGIWIVASVTTGVVLCQTV